MGSRLSKNIMKIGLIESGSLAKIWSDGRSVTKVRSIALTETERVPIKDCLKKCWL